MSETPINASDIPASSASNGPASSASNGPASSASTLDLAAAQQVLEADKVRRLQAFQAGLQKLLEEHRCEIFAVIQVGEDGRTGVAVPGARALP